MFKYYGISSGNYVVVETDCFYTGTGKRLRVGFMHMEHPYFFGEGSRVERGDHVGYVGKTGNASGYHLHLIVFKRDENVNWVTDSNRLNPQRFFPGVPFTGDTSVLLLFCIVLARCETAEKHPEDSENVNSQTMDSTENTTEPGLDGIGGEGMGYMHYEYDVGFYGVEQQFEMWLDSAGFNDIGGGDPEKLNIIAFIKDFNIPKEDFKKANLVIGEEYKVFSDKQIEALYSDDKNFLARMHIFFFNDTATTEIYTPMWLADHSMEKIRAVGITDEMLWLKYAEWIESEKLAVNSEICTKTKALLEAFD